MEAGCTLWFTGMSGSGKSTLSSLLATRLRALGARVEVIDGDVVRTQLCHGLGFSKDDRQENIRRIGFVCELLSRNGVIAIAAAISPYRVCRDELRSRIANFIEIYMRCPVEVLVQRDAKGLYKKALAGEIPHFTGISDPYEPPPAPEVTIDSSSDSLEDSVASILRVLQERGIIGPQRESITSGAGISQ
jgi:adenylyl-sulfate kinase